jgi:hypothetical protein
MHYHPKHDRVRAADLLWLVPFLIILTAVVMDFGPVTGLLGAFAIKRG